MRQLRTKIIIVLIVIGISLYFLYPTVKLATMSPAEREKMATEEPTKYDKLLKKSIKLGLDLKGGMHLVLEVDDSRLKSSEKKDVLDRALEVVRNRVDQFGVSEPVIQKEGTKRLIVQLPGLQDAERAKRLIGETAMLEWCLVRKQSEVAQVLRKLDEAFKQQAADSLVEVKQGKAATASADTSAKAKDSELAAKTDTTTLPRLAPLDSAMADSLTIPGQEETRFNVPLETVNKDKPFTSLLSSFYRDWILVKEENIPRVRRMLAKAEKLDVLPKDSKFIWFDDWVNMPEGGRGKFLFLVATDEVVTGRNLVNATPRPNPQAPNQLLVSFRFNRKGARELAKFTGKNVGRYTAIILDGKIKSYPVIKSKIPDGQGVIEGSFTDVEAKDLAIVLRAGALPAPLIIREERTVGPSLGADSIRQGLRAALYGFIVVVVFMIIYYKLSGLIASTALILNIIILLGLLAYLGAALTLPGIAGVILTIGMAVDANVLIFERIREELRKEKTVRSAIDAGYNRAFTTIFDANLTTLITAVVLWQFGTGPIKGFATTLSIGISASMFTAIVFTKLIYQLWMGNRQVQKLSI
ncbi:MAG: protein translocase subunit SecD [Candidatus Latescibacteria bacterium 4484_7]|nr:MAG: protein translocase subunit SecD [Candidatus Latescibacteria bacterium 4484_7]